MKKRTKRRMSTLILTVILLLNISMLSMAATRATWEDNLIKFKDSTNWELTNSFKWLNDGLEIDSSLFSTENSYASIPLVLESSKQYLFTYTLIGSNSGPSNFYLSSTGFSLQSIALNYTNGTYRYLINSSVNTNGIFKILFKNTSVNDSFRISNISFYDASLFDNPLTDPLPTETVIPPDPDPDPDPTPEPDPTSIIPSDFDAELILMDMIVYISTLFFIVMLMDVFLDLSSKAISYAKYAFDGIRLDDLKLFNKGMFNKKGGKK